MRNETMGDVRRRFRMSGVVACRGRSAETLFLEGVSQQLYDGRQARSGHVQGKPREVKQYCSDKSIRE
jgi:hypothetical protein